MSNEKLKDALDGLMDAAEYAEDIGENDLSRRINELYQELADKSPNSHWDDVHTYIVKCDNVDEVLDSVKNMEGILVSDSEGSEILVHTSMNNKARITDLSLVQNVKKVRSSYEF